MNTMKRSLLLGAVPLITLLALGGCDNGLTDLNKNPNGPTEVDARYLFPNATVDAVNLAFGTGLNMDLTELWVQHYAESQYSTEDRYDLADGRVSGLWSGFYSGPLQDFYQVIQKGETAAQPNVAALGRIMESWTFSIVTDLWGDVGYSDALRGLDDPENMTPTYDSQQAVYGELFAALKRASAGLDEDAPAFGNADLIYGGDVAKWRKFANSLRLRLAMRLSEADPATAQAEFAAALADGVFASNDDNATFVYLNDGINVNPLYAYQVQGDRDDHAVSATLVNTLQALSDPRLAVYANENDYGTYAGMPNGTTDPALPFDSISRIGDRFVAADAPAVLMSYAEVLFLQAEAAARGWISGDAAELYNAAIAASMQQYKIPEAEIDAYLAQPEVAYGGLQSIAVQKWIALYGNGPEAYAEWRRTGYPALQPGPDALTDAIPVRLPYPSSEQSLNGTNLAEAVSRQGGASLSNPLWWDRN